MQGSLQDQFSKIKSNTIPLFKTQKSLKYDLSIEQLQKSSSKTLVCSLIISNLTNQQIIFSQTFPDIFLSLSQCSYLFPQEPLIYSSTQGKYNANYGGRMHFPFASIQKDQQCLFFAISDKSGGFKQFKLQKKQNEIRFGALYYDLKLSKGESLNLPSFIIAIEKIEISLLHTSILLYNKYSSQWLQPLRQNTITNFQQSFLMRVLEFYQLQWHSSHKRIQKIEELNLSKMLEEDQQKVGKIGFVHFRDWSAQGNGMNTKFGNYLSKQLVGSKINKQWLRDQIRKIQMTLPIRIFSQQIDSFIKSIPVNTTLKNANAKLREQALQYLGSKNFTLCNSDQEWRALLSSTVNRVYQNLEPAAIYIDQFGFGFKTSPYKTCTTIHHRHCEKGNKSQNFDLQKGQLWTLKAISQSSRVKGLKIYIQQIPCDAAFPYIDGCLSSAAKQAASVQHQIPLLLTRFIHPQIKIYELITQYTMSQQQFLINKPHPQNVSLLLRAIAISFWNGNGIYLPKNLAFYNQQILKLIKILNMTFSKYKDFFWGNQAHPLIIGCLKKGVQQIVGNKWINKFGKELYILGNFSKQQQSLNIKQQYITMKRSSLGLLAYDRYEDISNFEEHSQGYSLCLQRKN